MNYDTLEDETLQEQPPTDKPPTDKKRIAAMDEGSKVELHWLEKMFGRVIGGLIMAIFGIKRPQKMPGINVENSQPLPADAEESNKTGESKSSAMEINKKEADQASTKEPNEQQLSEDPRLHIDAEERVLVAIEEIMTWELTSDNVSALRATSIKDLVKLGHIAAQEIVEGLDLETLEYIAEAIEEIKPTRKSELSLIKDMVHEHIYILDKSNKLLTLPTDIIKY